LISWVKPLCVEFDRWFACWSADEAGYEDEVGDPGGQVRTGEGASQISLASTDFLAREVLRAKKFNKSQACFDADLREILTARYYKLDGKMREEVGHLDTYAKVRGLWSGCWVHLLLLDP